MSIIDLPRREKGCYTDWGFSGYGAVLRMCRLNYVDQRVVQPMAEALMLSVAAKCTELRARAIGHIKCHIRTAAGSLKADTLGVAHGAFSTGHLTRPVRNLDVAISSIVQGIPEEAVKAATLEAVHEIADNYGFDVFKDKEHLYFDEIELADSLLEASDGEEDFDEDD